VGIAAEHAQLERRYQANTERRRRVLSLVTLGRRILATHAIELIPPTLLAEALESLRDLVPRFTCYSA
jgi:GAF domain-containing protein